MSIFRIIPNYANSIKEIKTYGFELILDFYLDIYLLTRWRPKVKVHLGNFNVQQNDSNSYEVNFNHICSEKVDKRSFCIGIARGQNFKLMQLINN